MSVSYPKWLDRFNFPPDIDKPDLSNQTRALLWGLGGIIDAIEQLDAQGGIKTVSEASLLTISGAYLEWVYG